MARNKYPDATASTASFNPNASTSDETSVITLADPMAAARWTAHLEGGPRRVNHAATAIEELVYSFGGYCTGDNYKDRRVPIDVFVLNVATLRWHAVPRPDASYNSTDGSYNSDSDSDLSIDQTEENSPDWPFQRYGHTVAPHGDQIYLFGGRNDQAPCNTLYKFDTKSYTWSKPKVKGQIPAERDGHSACIIRDHMYIFGGYEEMQFRFGLDVYRLNLKTLLWELCICGGDPPIYRDFHSATAIGSKMYIFGGRSDISGGVPGQILGSEFYSNKVHYLDVNSLTWHTPEVNNAPTSEAIEAAQAAAAGAADAPSPFFKPFAPDGRRSHSAINLDGHLLIFGGYNGRQDKHYNDMWLLQTAPKYLWRKLTPKGPKGPNRRRRQAMCRVGDRVVIFGGTSPYHGPPIIFTQQQQDLMPEHDPFSVKLVDHNDLYVLDLNPSLKTLCFQVVKARNLDTSELPRDLKIEFANLTRPNSITTKLPTLPLG